jgi:ribosomal protein S27E
MNKRFDPATQSLLEPVTVGELKYKSIRTGALFDAKADDTLLASSNEGQVDVMDKFKNTIRTTAYEPVNPYMHTPCPKCNRQLVRFQRLGDAKTVVHVCICGHIWT